MSLADLFYQGYSSCSNSESFLEVELALSSYKGTGRNRSICSILPVVECPFLCWFSVPEVVEEAKCGSSISIFCSSELVFPEPAL